MGDFKELPLMKGIERMTREKVSGDGARVSACTGALRRSETGESGFRANVAKTAENPNVRVRFFHWQLSSSKANYPEFLAVL